MQFLHTMVRVTNVEDSLRFYCQGLGLEEVRRTENEKGRYTLIFLRAPGDAGGEVELIQEGTLPPQEPWLSMPNTGKW